MQFSVRDVARIFHVREKEVYRWIDKKELPAQEIQGKYRFNSVEVLEWATRHTGPRSPCPTLQAEDLGAPVSGLEQALRRGGIFYRIEGTSRESVLKAVLRCMPLSAEVDRELLLQVLMSREAVGSTCVGDGLALPHPCYPVVLSVDQPFVTLCFLERPIPYGPPDAPLVHTLFAPVCPNVRSHLGLLARLGAVLRDESFRDLLSRQGPPEEILARVRSLEAETHVNGSASPAEVR